MDFKVKIAHFGSKATKIDAKFIIVDTRCEFQIYLKMLHHYADVSS